MSLDRSLDRLERWPIGAGELREQLQDAEDWKARADAGDDVAAAAYLEALALLELARGADARRLIVRLLAHARRLGDAATWRAFEEGVRYGRLLARGMTHLEASRAIHGAEFMPNTRDLEREQRDVARAAKHAARRAAAGQKAAWEQWRDADLDEEPFSSEHAIAP